MTLAVIILAWLAVALAAGPLVGRWLGRQSRSHCPLCCREGSCRASCPATRSDVFGGAR